jgi:hypothetical protein
VKKTSFYLVSDLKNLAVATALKCVREENEAAKKHIGEETYKHGDKHTPFNGKAFREGAKQDQCLDLRGHVFVAGYQKIRRTG